MAGKSKGGREVRKPKQGKTVASAGSVESLMTSQPKPKGK